MDVCKTNANEGSRAHVNMWLSKEQCVQVQLVVVLFMKIVVHLSNIDCSMINEFKEIETESVELILIVKVFSQKKRR